jgi:hypothetical protein
MYSFVWNHIVCKTNSFHVLIPAFKNRKMKAPFRKGIFTGGVDIPFRVPERRVHYPVFKCRGSVHVKSLFFIQRGSRQGCKGTFGPRVKVHAAPHHATKDSVLDPELFLTLSRYWVPLELFLSLDTGYRNR